MLSDEEGEAEIGNRRHVPRGKRAKCDQPPSYRQSRDSALQKAFHELAKAHGELPEVFKQPQQRSAEESASTSEADSITLMQSYLDFIDRGCVRELFAMIENWRPPKEWRDWPVAEKERAEFKETMLLIGSRGDDDASSTLQLHVAHLRKISDKLELTLSEVSVAYSDVLLPGARFVQWAWAALRKRAAGDVIFCMVGYIGDLTTSLAITRQCTGRAATPLLKALSPAGQRDDAMWVAPKALDAERCIPLNVSQHDALNGLRKNVELICGPPGTGKSTTIHAMVLECMQPNEPALICAVQNRAIEAIAQKFISAKTPFIVAGRRPTGAASEWTLETQLNRHDGCLNAMDKLARYTARLESIKAVVDKAKGGIFNPVSSGSYRASQASKLVQELARAAVNQENTPVWAKSGFKETRLYQEWIKDYPNKRCVEKMISNADSREVKLTSALRL